MTPVMLKRFFRRELGAGIALTGVPPPVVGDGQERCTGEASEGPYAAWG